jgi:hypothetical protein
LHQCTSAASSPPWTADDNGACFISGAAQLGKPISLMSLHFPSAATQLYQKYPFFRSSVFERRRLFEHPQHQSATVPEALHSLKTARTAR